MAVQPRLSYATAPGGRLAYHVVGDGGGRWVIWSQWIAQHLDLMWTDPTIEAMVSGLARDDLSSLVVQPRGVGLSDPGTRAATIEEQAADLLAVMDAEGIEQATIAAIFGAPAMLLAAQHPERVRDLVLYSWPLTGPLVDGEADGWTPDAAREYAEAYRRAGRSWGSGATMRAWDTGLSSPYNVRLMGMGERCSANPELAREHVEIILAADGRSIVEQVRVPARVLARPSAGAPMATMRALADALPNGTYHELPPSRLGDSIGDAFVAIARQVAEMARGDVARYGQSERVLASVLFTDIVGSTQALAQVGDAAWATTLGEYHRLVRQAVTAEGGRLVDTAGDGTLCELPNPAAAIRSARAIALAGRDLGVETRAGVHVGECERLGQDLAGMAVHVGARISSLAGPGEVLVSRTVRDLVSGSELAFVPRGEHELKGVPGRWAVFALRQGDDATDAGPPLAPIPTGVDQMVMRLARRSPRTLQTLNQMANALQRRVLSGRG